MLQQLDDADHDQQRRPGKAEFHPVRATHLVEQEQDADGDEDSGSHEIHERDTGRRGNTSYIGIS